VTAAPGGFASEVSEPIDARHAANVLVEAEESLRRPTAACRSISVSVIDGVSAAVDAKVEIAARPIG
jgi:hypothetical protein